MKKLSLLFAFILLFINSYSITPKMDKNDFPKYFNNTSVIKSNITHQNKKDNINRYFSFQLKDLSKESEGFLVFQINSSLSPKNISYTYINEPKERVNINRIEDYKYKTWHSPYLFFKHKFNDKIIYEFSIYMTKSEMSKQTIIIRVGPSLKDEKCTCEITRNVLSPTLKILINNNNNKKHKIDISKDYKWKKPKFDGNNHNHNWDNKLDRPAKYNNKQHFHKYRKNNGRIIFAISLISIWSLIFILYCLVNRRKKSIINKLKNQEQINLSQYHNI